MTMNNIIFVELNYLLLLKNIKVLATKYHSSEFILPAAMGSHWAITPSFLRLLIFSEQLRILTNFRLCADVALKYRFIIFNQY